MLREGVPGRPFEARSWWLNLEYFSILVDYLKGLARKLFLLFLFFYFLVNLLILEFCCKCSVLPLSLCGCKRLFWDLWKFLLVYLLVGVPFDHSFQFVVFCVIEPITAFLLLLEYLLGFLIVKAQLLSTLSVLLLLLLIFWFVEVILKWDLVVCHFVLLENFFYWVFSSNRGLFCEFFCFLLFSIVFHLVRRFIIHCLPLLILWTGIDPFRYLIGSLADPHIVVALTLLRLSLRFKIEFHSKLLEIVLLSVHLQLKVLSFGFFVLCLGVFLLQVQFIDQYQCLVKEINLLLVSCLYNL